MLTVRIECHIKSESQPTTAISTNGSTILAINGAISSMPVIAILHEHGRSIIGGPVRQSIG